MIYKLDYSRGKNSAPNAKQPKEQMRISFSDLEIQ